MCQLWSSPVWSLANSKWRLPNCTSCFHNPPFFLSRLTILTPASTQPHWTTKSSQKNSRCRTQWTTCLIPNPNARLWVKSLTGGSSRQLHRRTRGTGHHPQRRGNTNTSNSSFSSFWFFSCSLFSSFFFFSKNCCHDNCEVLNDWECCWLRGPWVQIFLSSSLAFRKLQKLFISFLAQCVQAKD